MHSLKKKKNFQRASRNKGKNQERGRYRIQKAENLRQEKGRIIEKYHIKSQDDSCKIDVQIKWTILE